LEFYTILMSYADDLQAVSVDEALIDVTSTVAQTKVVPTGVDDENDCTSADIAKELAEDMRTQIKATTGCEGTVCVVSDHKQTLDIVFSKYWNRTKYHARASRHPARKASWFISLAPSRPYGFAAHSGRSGPARLW
jgi:hypothetical protein